MEQEKYKNRQINKSMSKELRLFLIPSFYFLRTRLESKFQKISWFFVYYIPSLIIFNHYKPLDNFTNFFIYLLGITVINIFYENGYIENDSKTTKIEANPNMRISQKEFNFVDKNFYKIILIRLFLAALLISIFYYYSNDWIGTLILILTSVLIQIIYLFYNRVRNIANLYLILPLSFLRFYGYILPFVPYEKLIEFAFAVSFIYPISKTLEFATRKRFKINFFIKNLTNIDRFRVFYYLTISIVFFLIQVEVIFFYIAIYYLLYRTATFLLISKQPGINKELTSRKKH